MQFAAVVAVPSSFGDGVVYENGTLHIAVVSEAAAGKYTCVAANNISSVEASTHVFVMCEYERLRCDSWIKPSKNEGECGH